MGETRPCPLFVHSVDFRGFGVGAGEVQQTLNRMSIFSVFLCDFRVFRVMIRPSKRIPYTKSKYIQKIHNGNPGFTRKHRPAHAQTFGLVARQSLGRKSEICSAKTALTERSASAEVLCFASNPPSHEIHEKFHENTKKKESVGWDTGSTLPRPPHGIFENQRNARKGGQGRGGR